MFHPASPPSVVAFLLVCAVVVTAFLRGIWISAKPEGSNPFRLTLVVSVGLLVWLATVACIVGSGWLEAGPGRLALLGGTMFAVSVVFALSPLGKGIALACSIPWLVAFQGFRLPLELILHSWVHQGVIPQTMTWNGANWDILSGVAALALAPFSRSSSVAAWIANIIGIILLVNVGRVAVLSAPVPFGWQDVTPKLLLPYHLPYALIIPVCVGGALAGHVILTRALIRAHARNS